MHRCEEFRERIAQYVIDGTDVPDRDEWIDCSDCAEFYAQAREAIEILDQAESLISDEQWHGIESRLRRAIAAAPAGHPLPPRPNRSHWTPWLAAAAALLLVVIGLYRLPRPHVALVPKPVDASKAVVAERDVPLDPVTVDFLLQSELLLRSVMKIGPGDLEDLADAKNLARRQLPELGQRKQAAEAAPPVVRVMETYETILRDLRNIDRRNAGEDIADIQKRIERNGLIAGIKAFQPNVTPARYVLR